MGSMMNKPIEYWIKFKIGGQLPTHQIVDVSMNTLNDSIHVIEYSAYEQSAQRIAELEAENEKLKINLGTCKNDYWFMINLLEKYSSDKEEAFKACIERMKFRKPLFKGLIDSIPREDVEGLVRALEDYADRMNYNCGDYPYPWIYTDNGNTALNALTEFKAKQGGVS